MRDLMRAARRLRPLIVAALFAGMPALGQDASLPAPTIIPFSLPADLGPTARLGPLIFRGGLTLGTADGSFHGFSGLWVSPDGKRLVGVEQGKWVTGRLGYDRSGNLTGFTPMEAGWLLDEQGKPFTSEDDNDSEGLDFDGNRFIVGFETNDRILTYKSLKGPAERVPLPREALEDIYRGAGYSSVAALRGGGQAFLAEYTYADPKTKVFAPNNRNRGWLRFRDGSAGPFWLRSAPGWLPVSLTQMPDDDLLLVELHLDGKGVVDQGRISRIALAELKIGNTVSAEELALFAAPMPSARIEGVSIRKGRRGETLIYMMATSTPSQLYLFELTPRR